MKFRMRFASSGAYWRCEGLCRHRQWQFFTTHSCTCIPFRGSVACQPRPKVLRIPPLSVEAGRLLKAALPEDAGLPVESDSSTRSRTRQT